MGSKATLKLNGIVQGEVQERSTQYGQMLSVRVGVDADSWADLLEVPATDDNRKRYVTGASVTDLPVKAFAVPTKSGKAFVKLVPAL